MWKLGVWEVFSGDEAVYASHLATAVTEFLRGRPSTANLDLWGRPRFISYGAVVEDRFAVCVKEFVEMTRKKAGNENGHVNNGIGIGAGSVRWVNCALSVEAETQCETLAEDTAELGNGLVNLLSAGLDISVKRTLSGEWMACLFGLDVAKQKLGLSSWGSSASDAIAGLLIKWHVMLDGTFEGAPASAEKSRFR